MAVAKYITGKITDSAGNPRSGFRVLATLSQACTIPGTQEVIPISVGTVTGADGTWTLQQYATNDLTPGNTFVSIFEDGSTVPLTIQVPQGTDSGGHVGSLADPFHVSLLTTSTPTASPTPNNVTSLNVSGPATFSGSMIEGKDFQRSSQTVTEAVLVSGIDATAGEMVSVTLTANRVVGLPLNPVTGQELQLRVTQGGTGNYTLTWPAGIKTKWQPAPAVGAISTLTLRYYATAWQQVAGQVAVSDAGVLVHQGPAVVQSLTVSNSPYASTAPTAYGAMFDGVTDDTAAWNLAAAAVAASGGAMEISPGASVVGTTTTVTISKPTSVRGRGALINASLGGVTLITCPSQTVSAFTVTSDGCSFEDIAIVNTASSPPSAGAGILFSKGNMMRVRNVATVKFYNNIQVDKGWFGSITDSMFSDHVNYGLLLRNTDFTDDGDVEVHDCQFAFLTTARQAAAHIRCESGGGYRLSENKFNGYAKADGAYPGTGSVDAAIDCAVADGVSTSDLVLTGNSIENARTFGVVVRQAGTTGSFNNVVITGNQFSNMTYGVWIGAVSDNTKIKSANVTGNTFDTCSTGIYAQYMQSLTIGPNDHKNSGGGYIIELGTIADASSTGVTGILSHRISPQNVNGDSILLFLDSITAASNGHGPHGQTRHEWEREIPICTSTSVYVTLYRITIPNFAAGQIEVVFAGQINGKGAAMASTRQTYSRGNAGSVTCTVIGTDATAGFGFDYLLDTATVAGEIQVKARLNSVVGGTDLCGYCAVRTDGPLRGVKKGP